MKESRDLDGSTNQHPHENEEELMDDVEDKIP
jgi:hypothetical protein